MRLNAIIPYLQQTLLWPIIRPLLVLFFSFRTRGLEQSASLAQAIFAVNHSSEWDVVMFTAAFPFFSRFKPLYFVSRKKEFYSSPRFGWRRLFYREWYFTLWGGIAAPEGLHDYAQSLKKHRAALKEGYSLLIFPEGKMTRDGALHEGHGGVGYLALTTGIPVVPVRITGTFNLTLRQILTSAATVGVNFGEPLYAKGREEPSVAQCKAFARLIMGRIAALSAHEAPAGEAAKEERAQSHTR